jgi:iron uptake system component EfeO
MPALRPLSRTTTRPAALALALMLGAGVSACGAKEQADPGPAAASTPLQTSEPGAMATPTASSAASPAASAASADASTVTVGAGEGSCGLDKAEVPAGVVVLKITNSGGRETEVYVFSPEGRIITEREGIKPGETADLTVELGSQGEYEIRCKPGLMDDAARSRLKVSAGAPSDGSPAAATAVAAYRDFVAGQVDDTIAATQTFVAALKAGDLAQAKSLYAPSRVGWETIEPVAESFGDIDPKVDLREADLEGGDTWTGWHKIEKSLWADGTTKDMGPVGDRLLVDLESLRKRVPDAEITPTSMANGAKELLDEVASGKITGEEEAFSHTDLVDFKGNLDGARKVFELLRPIAEKKDPALTATLAQEFGDVERALEPYKEGAGYRSYEKVTQTQRKELTDVVNALAEPLSKLAAAVVS